MKLAWVAAALLAVSGGALADWQYTKWGMSVEQVVTASGGTAKKAKDEKDKRIKDQRRLVRGETAIGSLKVPVDFYFKDNKLSMIRFDLGLEDGCAEKETEFLKTFGAIEPRLTSTEFPGRHLIYAKSRTFTWPQPDGDTVDYTVIWFERPDLPGVKSKSICMSAQQPAKAGS